MKMAVCISSGNSDKFVETNVKTKDKYKSRSIPWDIGGGFQWK